MERLSDAPELLDGALDDPAVLDDNLRDLRRINRWLGGAALSASALEAVAPGVAEVTLLDIGTGGVDIPMALLRWAARRGRRLTVVGIDSRPEILAAALRTTPTAASTAGLTLAMGDGQSLRYADRSFDVAHASLLLHHLEPEAAVELLREMARIARLGVVINDLDRNRVGWLGAWLLGHLLTGNRYTRHDAPLSIRRAYRLTEAIDLCRAAGLTPVQTVRGLFGHRYAIAAVASSGGGGMTGSPDTAGAGE